VTFDNALSLARLGYPVIPLQPSNKRPYANEDVAQLAGVPMPNDGNGGIYLATTDEAAIHAWWSAWPGAMIGIPTGSKTGIAALDIDVKNGKDGWATIQNNGLPIPPDAPFQMTRSGGGHYLMSLPPGVTFPSDVNVIGNGLDRLGDGKYFVWYGVDLSAPRPLAPPWFTSKVAAKSDINLTGGLIIPGPARIAETIEYWTVNVRDAAAGERNNVLNNAAFAFGQIATACPERERELVAKLAAAAADCSLDARETDRTIKSGMRGGKNKPQRAPEGFNAPFTLPKGAYATRDEAEAMASNIVNFPQSNNPLRPDPICDEEWNDAGALTPACITENLYFADVGVRVAPGGVGKTTLALYEAMCLTLGYSIFGCLTRRPGVACILTSEDRRPMLIQRLRKICEADNLSTEQIERVRHAVRIVYVDQFKLTCVSGDMVVPSDGVRHVIEAFGPLRPSLIWIDPAVSFGVGENRVNDAEQGLITAGRLIRNAIPDCCIMFIHHSGKENGRNGTLDQYSGRGGSAMADGSRMVQVMKSLNIDEWREATGDTLDAGDSAFVLARPKLSYTPLQAPIYVKRVGWSFQTFGAQASGARNEKAEIVALALLRKRRERGEDVAKYRAHAALAKDPEADGIKKNKFDEAINSLINAGKLKISKNKRGSDIIVEGST
jgi:RecA-family ATPase